MKNVNSSHAQPIVCLDAGHYGKYNAYSVGGGYESQQMWKLHLLLKDALEEYGIKVITTRANQRTDLDLYERGRKAKGCDLFISLHSNAASAESVNYVVCMHQIDDDCGAMDAKSKNFAVLLANCVAKVMGARAQTWSTKGNRGDYYGVLRGAHSVKVAGVIIEHGFHTNKAQADWLMKDANLAKLAKAEAATIAEWFDVKKPVSEPAPTNDVVATEKPNGTKNAADRGEYKATVNSLALRNGAGTKPNSYGSDKTVLVRIDKGHKVQCYGYSRTVNGVKWLYVDTTVDGVKYTGFVSSEYLVATKTDTWIPKVGDIVNYNGTKHYANADAVNGTTCKGGQAKITNIYQLGKSKHPYHIVRVAGKGATVWGWVDEGSFTRV